MRSRRHRVLAWMMDMGRGIWGALGRPPPFFPATMGPVDPRLGQMTLGLGVVAGEARFYPVSAIGAGVIDDWHGRRLRVQIGPGNRIPPPRRCGRTTASGRYSCSRAGTASS